MCMRSLQQEKKKIRKEERKDKQKVGRKEEEYMYMYKWEERMEGEKGNQEGRKKEDSWEGKGGRK